MKNVCYVLVFLFFAINSYGQGWKKTISMPGGNRDAGVAFAIGTKIYSGGGAESGDRDFYEYDTQTKKWTKKANIPAVDTNRGFAAGFAINGKGYVGLGSDGVYTSVVKTDLWEYDPDKDTWTAKANFPNTAVDGVAVMVIGDKAYIGGGTDNEYTYYGLWEYDPSGNKWTRKANIPPDSGNVFSAMFSIGNYGYITGGATYESTGLVEYSQMYRYDPSLNTWTQVASFPGKAREAAVAFTMNGKGYVGLGQSQYSTVFNDMYSYDPTTDSWHKEDNFLGTPRAWASAVSIGDTAYIGNGAGFSGQFVTPTSDWWSFTEATASVQNSINTLEPSIGSFPNPAVNKLHISGLEDGHAYNVTISDVVGREVLRTRMTSQSGITSPIDVSVLSPGTYNIIVADGAKFSTSIFVKD